MDYQGDHGHIKDPKLRAAADKEHEARKREGAAASAEYRSSPQDADGSTRYAYEAYEARIEAAKETYVNTVAAITEQDARRRSS